MHVILRALSPRVILQRWRQLRHGSEHNYSQASAKETRLIKRLERGTFYCILRHSGPHLAGYLSEEGTIIGKAFNTTKPRQNSGD